MTEEGSSSSSFPQASLLAGLDPELDCAIDTYFEGLKQYAKFRCVQAFEQYGGEWRERTPTKLLEMLQEEIVDEHVYRAMYQWKLLQEQKNAGP